MGVLFNRKSPIKIDPIPCERGLDTPPPPDRSIKTSNRTRFTGFRLISTGLVLGYVYLMISLLQQNYVAEYRSTHGRMLHDPFIIHASSHEEDTTHRTERDINPIQKPHQEDLRQRKEAYRKNDHLQENQRNSNTDSKTIEEAYYTYYEVKNQEDTEENKDNFYYYYYTGHVGDPPIVVKKSPDKTSLTGAAANCNQSHKTSSPFNYSAPKDTHPDAGTITISCRVISYRAPLQEMERGGVPIIVGVLSAAGGRGVDHRDSIRSTWARNRVGIYFIVAGPWNIIQKEFAKYRDLIWIQENETYEGEQSVLPFKSESFITIVHKHSPSGISGYKFLFKTDDDSYVDMVRLENTLLLGQWDEPLDYWGKCTRKRFPPLRDMALKWAVSYDIYPEELYPSYCQGAGYALSRKFVTCAVDQGHVSQVRYNPFEDVSVGLLAERCGILPVTDERIVQYRGDTIVNMLASDTIESIKLLPKPTMTGGKIVQHRIKTHYEMYEHYLCSIHGC